MPGGRPPDRPYAPPPPSALSLIYEDAAFVVASKPAGLLSVPGRGDAKRASALTYLAARHGPVHAVHRLDMDTSGLIIFARSIEVHRTLSDAFANRTVSKTYHARVHGRPDADAGLIDLPIGRDWNERPRRQVDLQTGKPSRTRWAVEATGPDTSLLRLEPDTGRTHQLRVHLAAFGHPILGDRLYGNDDNESRLLLHASGLCFAHPENAVEISLWAPVPFA